MKTKPYVYAGLLIATPAAAQQAGTAALPVVQQPVASPMLIQQSSFQPSAVLPANTEISLAMNDTITTKGKRWSEGDTFDMTVTHNVMLGDYVVIPKGSRGVGRITWLTNKGAFGKSGKMEIDIEYVDVGGRRIPLSGHYRQEGEGNTVATVGTVIAVGVFAGFVTGKSGAIPAGRELIARTKEDLPVAFAGPAPAQVAAPLLVPASQPVSPVMQSAQPTPPSTTSTGVQMTKKVKCDTCR